MVFARLTFTGSYEWHVRRDGKRMRKLICNCSCGKTTSVYAEVLFRGTTRSCGCFMDESRRTTHFKHGESQNLANTREYVAWAEIKRRCYNVKSKSYPDYGGRGITMCERWLSSYANFLEDMGRKPTPGHSIERNDVNLGYQPDNCRWATRKEQNRNTRASRWIEFNGHRRTLAEWGEVTGIRSHTIHARLDKGWSVERALTEPAVLGKNQCGVPVG